MKRNRWAGTPGSGRSRPAPPRRPTACGSRRSAPWTSRLPPWSQPERTAGVHRSADTTPQVNVYLGYDDTHFMSSFRRICMGMRGGYGIPHGPHPQSRFLTTPWLWWWPLWTGWCCCTPPLYTAYTPLLSSHLHGWFWNENAIRKLILHR